MALPTSYKLLEYIESSGTQWINTNFTPDSNTRVVADVETTTTKPSANKWVFGCRSTSATQRYEIIYISSASAFRFYFNTSNYTFTGVTLGRLSIDVSSTKATINGVSVTPSAGSFDGAGPIYICSCNSTSVTSEAFAQKVYSFKIYDNGTLVRDYVPAERVSDGAVGLYDLVNNAFYTNAGTGAFTPGYIPVGPSRMLLANGTGYDVLGGKVLVGGTVYNILKGRTLVDGVGYDISFGTPLSSLNVGGSVYLNVDGVPTEFIIVHQGNPDSSLYDESCDGVWLLMKDIYENRAMDDVALDQESNDYQSSTLHNYLNGTFLGLFDSDIQAAVKQVKVPYHKGTGTAGSIASGASGLSTKVFLLSGYEVGWTNTTSTSITTCEALPIDGAKLDYFTPGRTTAAQNLRIAHYNGAASPWWLRSPYKNNARSFWNIRDDGDLYDIYYAVMPMGIRPAIILPNNAVIDDNYNVVA